MNSWASYFQGKKTGYLETSIVKEYTNVLEVTEAKYTILVFTQFRAKSIQVQMDNIVTPSLSDQNGRTQSNILSQLGNGILGLFTEKRDHGYY